MYRLRAGLLFTRLPFAILPIVAAGCTFIGFDNPGLRESIDWGPRVSVPICVYLDRGVTRETADKLLDWWNAREGNWYGLDFRPVSYEELDRDATSFFYYQISNQLGDVSLPRQCHRQIWFVSRNFGDAVYGLAATATGIPETMGWTDDDFHTKAWVYADVTPDFNQLLMWPGVVTRHELYHLVGCRHFDLAMHACYAAIRQTKESEEQYAIDLAHARAAAPQTSTEREP